MTIKDAKVLKQKAEAEILTIIVAMEKQSGCVVHGVSVRHIGHFTGDHEDMALYLDMRVGDD